MRANTPEAGFRCAQCGAASRAEFTCRDAFDSFLAFEFADPEAFGPVHHLTVACYYLQHPEGYTDDALSMWRRLLEHPEAGGAHALATMAGLREQFEGAARVREPARQPPAWWPRLWPHTAVDALPQDDSDRTAAGHVRRMRTWAASVRVTLNGAEQCERSAHSVRAS